MVIREERGPEAGATIVFVHGAGIAGWMWKKQMEAFPAFRKIVVDLPDHGLDKDRPFVDIETTADDLAAQIAEGCTGGKAHLVGHSLGAKIVLELLARRPERALSAVISSALVRPSLLASSMNSHALNVLSLWMLQSTWLAWLQARQFSFPDPDMEEAFVRDLRETCEENLDRPVSAFCRRLFLPPGLGHVSCPVLVTAGSKEPASMLGSLEDLVMALPGARQEIIPGANHAYPWVRYHDYNRLLEEWFAT